MLRDCPYSTKTREVLANPSPPPSRFPETREISRGRSPRGILRGWISQYLPRLGGVRTFSQHPFFYREWIRKSFPVGSEGLTVLKPFLPYWWWENEIRLTGDQMHNPMSPHWKIWQSGKSNFICFNSHKVWIPILPGMNLISPDAEFKLPV